MVCCIGSIGKVGISGTTVATNQQINSLMFGKQVHPRFGYYYCKYITPLLQAMAQNAVVAIINKGDFEKIEMPLPPPSEQRRIVEILDQADALRRRRAEADAKAARILPALFVKMFGDPATNPMGWDINKLGAVGKLDRGKSQHRPRNALELYNGPYPFIQTGDVANSMGYIRTYKQTYSELGLKQSKLWKKGTLCITIAANIAQTGILMFDACFPDSIVGFFPNEITTTEYVRYWLLLTQKRIEELAPASAQKNINLEILRSLDVPMPPVAIQQEFTTAVHSLESMSNQQLTNVEQIERIFQLLLRRAFSGELTARWREAYMRELLAEMEQQAYWLGLDGATGANNGVEHSTSDSYHQEALL